jgi:hypothetical protein
MSSHQHRGKPASCTRRRRGRRASRHYAGDRAPRLDLVPHDQTRTSARFGRRPPVGYERGGIQITRFGATLGVHLGDQVADQIGGTARVTVWPSGDPP